MQHHPRQEGFGTSLFGSPSIDEPAGALDRVFLSERTLDFQRHSDHQILAHHRIATPLYHARSQVGYSRASPQIQRKGNNDQLYYCVLMGLIFSIFLGILRVVRRTNWLSLDHRDVHQGMGEVVEESLPGATLSIHGKGQHSLPHGGLPIKLIGNR